MDYEEYMLNLNLEDEATLPIAANDETFCPDCKKKFKGGICPDCGLTKEAIKEKQEEEDERYEKRRERR
jgi:hypothetical protein